MKYTYTFSVWPDEYNNYPKALFDLFRLIGRVQMDFTEAEFQQFHHQLVITGLTLRAVTRTPWHEPEVVLCRNSWEALTS